MQSLFAKLARRLDPKEPQKPEKLPKPEAKHSEDREAEPDEVKTKPKASGKAKAKAKAEAKAEGKAKGKGKGKGRAKTERPAAAKTPGTKAPRKDPEFEPETVRRRLWQDSEDSEESPRKVQAPCASLSYKKERSFKGKLRTLSACHPLKFLT